MAIGRFWTVDRKLQPNEVLLSFPWRALFRVPELERFLRYRAIHEWQDGTTAYVVLCKSDLPEFQALLSMRDEDKRGPVDPSLGEER